VRNNEFVKGQGQIWRLRQCPLFLLLDIGCRHGRTIRYEGGVMDGKGTDGV